MNPHSNGEQHAAVDRVLAEFLERFPAPSQDDWKELIARYPEHAGEIADTALLYVGRTQLTEDDVMSDLDRDAFDTTLSDAINLVYATVNDRIDSLATKVSNVRGPALRDLAREVGLGPHVALLSSVLAGTVQAPIRLVERLTKVFKVSAFELAELFTQCFERRSLPAFKAGVDKPHVDLAVTSWSEAVRRLNLPSEQAEELLKLDQ